MAAADVISWGIGSPASIRAFILDGLSANAGASDTTPDQFSGETKTGQALSATVTFGPITLTGFDTTTTISVGAGGEYNIDGGAYTSVSGTIDPGQVPNVRHTSSASYSTAADTVLTVGGVSNTFTSITEGDPAQAVTMNQYGFGFSLSLDF